MGIEVGSTAKGMAGNRDPDTGRYTQSYTDQEVLGSLEGTRLGTSEVAEALECHRTTAHSKLRELEDRGLVTSTKVGNTLMWEQRE